MVSVIIPAFEEAGTVAESAGAALRHPDIAEVIVVDDGSADDTAAVAGAAGARVIRLERNMGKAAALDAGVKAATHDIVMFLDADVTGHTNETLSRIMGPVVEGRYEMYVGLRERRTVLLNQWLRIAPIIGGERALTRKLWDAVPPVHKNGFQIEIAMNWTSKRFPKGMGFELLRGTEHRTKEKKYGFVVGFGRRIVMMWEVFAIGVRLYVFGTVMRWLAGVGQRVRSLVRTG